MNPIVCAILFVVGYLLFVGTTYKICVDNNYPEWKAFLYGLFFWIFWPVWLGYFTYITFKYKDLWR